MRIDRKHGAAARRHALWLLLGIGTGALAQQPAPPPSAQPAQPAQAAQAAQSAQSAQASQASQPAPQPGATQAEKVFATVSPKIWTVKAAQPENNQFMIGSAVLIAPGRFITACHVVEKAIDIKLTNSPDTIGVDEVLRDPDNRRDMCLLRVAGGINRQPVPIAPISTLRVGQRVYVISSPRGLELSLTDGLISSLRQEPESQVPIIQSSTPVTSGSSGGGLFDEQGRLIGVVRSVATATENFAFSYPAEWVAQLPDRYAKEVAAWQTTMKGVGIRFSPDGQVLGSGFAAVSDLNALPVPAAQKAPVALAYRQFLLLAPPRAFVFTSDGKFGSISTSAELAQFQQQWQQAHVTYRFYAVDNAVVWNAAPAAQPKPPTQ